ncbi:hypothetical protein ACNONS_26010 [Bacteroides xylanisolvens]|jgi:hypothetical protein|uniref:hypothetical protein n=1 Tax=Bacteroides TaxID=816 RepID=UPI000ED711A8|nr:MULTISPECIES: hypothetical protein [Bacteroides]MDV7051518.1 hypothetical protein [Bacteroides ovatus]RJU32440.1 hypothetical protein DXA05_02870 [Bacteroides sp. AM54-2NS]
MVDQQYLIKNLLAGVAELGAANMLELLHPKMDLITQREAYKFFEERDTRYGESFTHGEAWVKKMVKEKRLHPQRKGKSDNSPLMYSKKEMIAVYNAEYAAIHGIFDGTQL